VIFIMPTRTSSGQILNRYLRPTPVPTIALHVTSNASGRDLSMSTMTTGNVDRFSKNTIFPSHTNTP